MILEQKYQALLNEARRCGQSSLDNLRACFDLLSLTAAIDHDCAARLAPYRLSEGKFVVLFLLRDRAAGLSPHELADKAGVTRATITGLLDGLERDGYLVRHPDQQDRRKVSVRLTAKGEETARDLFDQHTSWIASLFAGFSDNERRMLEGFLQRIRRNIDAGV